MHDITLDEIRMVLGSHHVDHSPFWSERVKVVAPEIFAVYAAHKRFSFVQVVQLMIIAKLLVSDVGIEGTKEMLSMTEQQDGVEWRQLVEVLRRHGINLGGLLIHHVDGGAPTNKPHLEDSILNADLTLIVNFGRLAERAAEAIRLRRSQAGH
jgi:DNA-binding transcriptional MerR regulator